MSGITRGAKQQYLDHLHGIKPMPFNGLQYVSLHSGDPMDYGFGELPAYSRSSVKFQQAGDARANAEAIRFDNLPAAVISHFGVWDNSVGGSMMWSGKFKEPKQTADGDSLEIPARSITHSF